MYNAHWIHSLPYSKFIELTLTYFVWENKLNRGANQLVFMGKITCFGKSARRGEKRSSTETGYQ